VIAYRLEDAEREEYRLDCRACPYGRRPSQDCLLPVSSVFRFEAAPDDCDGGTYVIENVCPLAWCRADDGLPLGDPFAMYNDYERGILPFGGGMLEQPHIYVECMRLISALCAGSARRRRMESEKENERRWQ